MPDRLEQESAATTAALRLTGRQRVALAAAQKHGLEHAKSGYRLAFTMNPASFQTRSVHALVAAGLLEKRGGGLVGITPAGSAVLAHAPSCPAPQPYPPHRGQFRKAIPAAKSQPQVRRWWNDD